MDKTAETKDTNLEKDASELDQNVDQNLEAQEGNGKAEAQEDGAQEAKEEVDELTKLKTELAASKEAYLYLVAEFENYKKRQVKERQELLAYGNERIIRDLLGALDGINMAIVSMPDSPQTKAIIDGIKMIENMLISALSKHGVEKVKTEGMFDMHVHEAIKREKKEGKEKNAILEVQQEGYTLNGRLLRPARVVVAE